MYSKYGQVKRGRRCRYVPRPKRRRRCTAVPVLISLLHAAAPLCLFLNLLFSVYGMTPPVSPVTVSLLAAGILCVIRFFDCVRKGFDLADITAVLFIITTVGTAFCHSHPPLEKVIIFLMMPMLLWATRTLPCPKIYRTVTVFGACLLSVFYLLATFTDLATSFGVTLYTYSNHKDLTLGYNNPNETAIYLLLTAFLTLYGASLFAKRIKLSVPLFALSISQLYLLYLTNSRTCLVLGVAVCALFVLAFVPPLRKILTSRAVCMLVLAIPVIFFLMSYCNIFGVFNIQFLGEVVETGRYQLYREVIRNISPIEILIGDTAAYAGVNLHNTYLSVFSAYGMPLLLNLILLLYLTFKQAKGARLSRAGTFAYGFALCIIIHTAAESALLFSGGVFAVVSSIPFALAFGHCPPETRTGP